MTDATPVEATTPDAPDQPSPTGPSMSVQTLLMMFVVVASQTIAFVLSLLAPEPPVDPSNDGFDYSLGSGPEYALASYALVTLIFIALIGVWGGIRKLVYKRWQKDITVAGAAVLVLIAGVVLALAALTYGPSGAWETVPAFVSRMLPGLVLLAAVPMRGVMSRSRLGRIEWTTGKKWLLRALVWVPIAVATLIGGFVIFVVVVIFSTL